MAEIPVSTRVRRRARGGSGSGAARRRTARSSKEGQESPAVEGLTASVAHPSQPSPRRPGCAGAPPRKLTEVSARVQPLRALQHLHDREVAVHLEHQAGPHPPPRGRRITANLSSQPTPWDVLPRRAVDRAARGVPAWTHSTLPPGHGRSSSEAWRVMQLRRAATPSHVVAARPGRGRGRESSESRPASTAAGGDPESRRARGRCRRRPARRPHRSPRLGRDCARRSSLSALCEQPPAGGQPKGKHDHALVARGGRRRRPARRAQASRSAPAGRA